MTVFLLHEHLEFPHPELSEPDGLLAVGGDLSIERLLIAYKSGIFPWYQSDPILWWSPPLRPVIFPVFFRMSRSLYQTLKKNLYRVTFDKKFYDVIKGCANAPRKNSAETWVTPEMINAYCNLFESKIAHSVEVWFDGKLVGGLYGVSIGKAFFGESMFTLMKDASKVALACLVEHLINNNFYFIDCQVTNSHLISIGAFEMPRQVFLTLLKEAIKKEEPPVKWVRDTELTSTTAIFLKEKLIPRRK